MAFLEAVELKNVFYKPAASMEADDVTTYLMRANAFAKGEIGGVPPTVDDDLKVAVALAFEIFTKGETAQADDVTGNITEAAPAGFYVRESKKDPLDIVRNMLRPYKLDYQAANIGKTDRGAMFL